MTWLSALLLTLLGGVINGSFAIPTKFVTRWRFENTWLVFSVLTYFLGPWCFLLAVYPGALSLYAQISTSLLQTLVLGGLLFGVGQIGFSVALDTIGMGLAFVINISLSTALGPLLPLMFLHDQHLWRADVIMTLVGVVIIISGVLVSYVAGKRRDRNLEGANPRVSQYSRGVCAAVLAGVGSAGQNFTFAKTVLMQKMALAAGANRVACSFIIWPGFLSATFLPYATYMLYRNVKHRSFSVYRTAEKRFYGYAVLMAVLWLGSLVCYSQATHLIGDLGPVVIWPLFMVTIILASHFWGWRFGEWAQVDVNTRRLASVGIVLFVLAVMVFSYAAYLSHHF